MAARAIRICALLTALAVLLPLRASSSSAAPAPRPTPTIPNLTGDPEPEPEPSPTERDKPRPDKKSPSVRKTQIEKPSPKSDSKSRNLHRRLEKLRKKGKLPAWVKNYRTSGTYSTSKLDAIAFQLATFGWRKRDLLEVYRGFPIGGATDWTNSWGAPRHEFGHHYRHHEGQDLFCDRGAPVLATQRGRIEFDVVELGGRVARLWREDGTYWYYAHLSTWNESLTAGDRVAPGDVIGYCGTTGNAVGTPPHVHFGWYSGQVAINPITHLSKWLGKAEKDAGRILNKEMNQRRRKIEALTTKRRFGDLLNSQNLVGESSIVTAFMDLMLNESIREQIATENPMMRVMHQGVDPVLHAKYGVAAGTAPL